MSWLGEKMGLPASVSSERADRAIRMSEEVIIQSKSLRQQLEPFREAKDPFLAIKRATSRDGEY